MHISPPVAYAAVLSKTVVLLLLIHSLLLFPLFVGVQCLVITSLFGNLCPSNVASNLSLSM